MISHKLLCLFQGKCWHEWEWNPTFLWKDKVYLCTLCGERCENVQTPDYSSPNTYMPFLQWFWKEKGEMWQDFCYWLSPSSIILISTFPYYFMLTEDNEPRIMVLLSEWLALPETKEKWEWEDCKCTEVGEGYVIANIACLICKGETRVKAEWANDSSTSNKKEATK